MVLVNPAAALLGTTNAVLTARARQYESRFASAISIKGVVCGSATWETRLGRFELVPGMALLLEDGEEYTVTVDALQPVETFNVFFARGFIEDAAGAAATGSAALLDDDHVEPVHFAERLCFGAPVLDALRRARAAVGEQDRLEHALYDAAAAIVNSQPRFRERAARLPALRAATRQELARRVAIGTAWLHANASRRITVAQAATEACLSPFHFHRLFAAFHGIPPHRYLTRLRLDLARALLRSTDRPVIEIATACGFESLGSFTTLFGRATGVPPARFRRNGETS